MTTPQPSAIPQDHLDTTASKDIQIHGAGLSTDASRTVPEWAWLLLLISLPLIAQFSGAYELFPRPGWVDPMIYVGHFLDPASQIQNLGAYYFSQRVPYIILGSLFYAVFSPTYAHIALSLFFQLLALISTYAIGRKFFGPLASVVSGWWLGVNPLWIASVTNGYIDGPAIALSLTAISLLLLGCDQSRRPAELLLELAAGFLLACVLALHPVPALLTGVAFLTTLLTTPSAGINLIGRSISIIGGALLSLLLMAIYSTSIGAAFLFLIHDVHPIKNAFAGNVIPYVRPLEDWLSKTFRISLPFLVLALFLPLMASPPNLAKAGERQLALIGLSTLFASFIVIAIWDLVIRGMMAQSWFYASYTLIGLNLMMTVAIGTLLLGRKQGIERDILMLTAMGISIIAALCFHEQIAKAADDFGTASVWVAILFTSAAVITLAINRLSRQAIVGIVLLSSMIGIVNTDTRFTFTQHNTTRFRVFFELALDIRMAVDKAGLTGRRVVLWVDRKDFKTADLASNEHANYYFFAGGKTIPLNTFDSLAALWLWDKGTLNFDMPNLTVTNEEWLKKAQMPTSLVIVCSDPAVCSLGRAKLDALNIPSTIRSHLYIWKPGLKPTTVLIVDYVLP